MINFITGFPRAGSTLLAALFRQNPQVHASGVISPMGPIVRNILGACSPAQETHVMVTEKQRISMIEAAFDAFYEDHLDKIIFDTNRMWQAYLPLLQQVFPSSKVICCVRPIVDVVNSFEHLFRKHPTYLSTIYGNNQYATVYERVNAMMLDDGVVGYALKAFSEAWYGATNESWRIIEYENLASQPAKVMDWLHEQFGFSQFNYDYSNIAKLPNVHNFDLSIGAPDLHILKPQVEYKPAPLILPPDIVAKLPAPFWRNIQSNKA